uniref:Apple domain-containing protein n=1 Tax=Meloidogyne incognita TaxID=6306 RepID=A0A914L8N0_MELIC
MMEDRKHCLEECFLDKRCYSLDFDIKNGTCRLFNYSSYSTLGTKQAFIAPLISKLDIDHYENILKLKNRCGARHIAFILIKDAELPSFKILKGQNLSLPDCLKKCLESLICISVQYLQGECIFGMEKLIEDQEPLLLDNSFLFEPICLPDPPNNLTLLDCLDEHVFEKVVNMELRGDNIEDLGVVRDIPNIKLDECLDACILDEFCLNIPNIKLDECLDACILDEFCLSINYYFKIENNSSTSCQILPFNRNNNNRTLSVLIQGVNYYELACKRERIGGNNFEQNFENENKEILTTTTSTITTTTRTTTTTITTTKLQKCSFLPNSGIQECNNKVATTTQTIFPTLITKEINFSKLTIKPKISDAEETTEKIIKTTSSKNSEIKNSEINNRIYLNQLNVNVFCDSQGANVSFQLKDNSQRYSGKIYAADRFDNCLLSVKNAKEFSFFVNKPGNNLIKNWCNAKINNDQLNILLVLSNSVGEGIPPEVTTKDDLFFYITCRYINGIPIPEGNVTNGVEDYSEMEPEKENNKKYMDEQTNFGENRGDTRIKLKILKNGKPINNVFIGEKLLAVVESNSAINAENFRVSECNATRVLPPITDDKLSEQIRQFAGPSIPLLDSNGCSLHPQIMGNMRRVGDHLEATLTAFRIDGGSELEIDYLSFSMQNC